MARPCWRSGCMGIADVFCLSRGKAGRLPGRLLTCGCWLGGIINGHLAQVRFTISQASPMTTSPDRFCAPIARSKRSFRQLSAAALMAGVLFLGTGCETPAPLNATAAPTSTSSSAEIDAWQKAGQLTEMLTIREGDSLKITFPGAPNLSSAQQVRADGIITLDIVGEVRVTGLTPKELEAKLAKLYETQLVSNEVAVAVVASSFDVYVSGEVLRPGKITSTKPITVFQAILEAGYNPALANLAAVTIIREESPSKYIYLKLNVQSVLEGRETRPFYLKPSDTIQVPKKISVL